MFWKQERGRFALLRFPEVSVSDLTSSLPLTYRLAGNRKLTRQEPVPIFINQLRILCQFPPDHKLLDPVYRMDIVHAVDDYPADFFQTLEAAHGGDSIALDEDIAVCKQLDGLVCQLKTATKSHCFKAGS